MLGPHGIGKQLQASLVVGQRQLRLTQALVGVAEPGVQIRDENVTTGGIGRGGRKGALERGDGIDNPAGGMMLLAFGQMLTRFGLDDRRRGWCGHGRPSRKDCVNHARILVNKSFQETGIRGGPSLKIT